MALLRSIKNRGMPPALPSNVKRAFKTAWRQKQYKNTKTFLTKNLVVELAGGGKHTLYMMIRKAYQKKLALKT